MDAYVTPYDVLSFGTLFLSLSLSVNKISHSFRSGPSLSLSNDRTLQESLLSQEMEIIWSVLIRKTGISFVIENVSPYKQYVWGNESSRSGTFLYSVSIS